MRVAWSKTAKLELKAAMEYWGQRNGSNKFSLKIIASTRSWEDKLIVNPYIGKSTGYGEVRVVVVLLYFLFYEVKGERIEVLSFFDCRQEPNRFRTT